LRSQWFSIGFFSPFLFICFDQDKIPKKTSCKFHQDNFRIIQFWFLAYQLSVCLGRLGKKSTPAKNHIASQKTPNVPLHWSAATQTPHSASRLTHSWLCMCFMVTMLAWCRRREGEREEVRDKNDGRDGVTVNAFS